jgi:hypothetical protein
LQPCTSFEPRGSTLTQIVKEFCKPVSDRENDGLHAELVAFLDPWVIVPDGRLR